MIEQPFAVLLAANEGKHVLHALCFECDGSQIQEKVAKGSFHGLVGQSGAASPLGMVGTLGRTRPLKFKTSLSSDSIKHFQWLHSCTLHIDWIGFIQVVFHWQKVSYDTLLGRNPGCSYHSQILHG